MSLPDSGWGLLMLTGSAPRTGSGWTDSGKPHDERHLKHRARKTTRPVPIPPELVTLLRAHQGPRRRARWPPVPRRPGRDAR